MRPGQLHPNEFEVALLGRLLAENAVSFAISDLHVLSREFTGVGSFTNFLVRGHPNAERKVLGTSASVKIPGLERGLGFVAFHEGERLVLEIFTYDEKWDGVFDGFGLETGA